MKKALVHIAIRLPAMACVSGALIAIAPAPIHWWSAICFGGVASTVADLWVAA